MTRHPHEPAEPDGEPDLATPEPLRDELLPAEQAPDPGDVEDWSP